MTGPALGVPAHRVALFIWVSLIFMLLLLLAVVIAMGGPPRRDLPRDAILAAVVATSALGLLLSRVLPPRIAARPAGGRGEIAALTRFLVGWSLCEGVAIFPLIAFLVTRDLRLLAVFAVDLAVLVAWSPTRARWESASRVPMATARHRMVR